MNRKILLVVLAVCSLPLFAQTDSDRKTGVIFSVGNAGGDIAFCRLFSPEWALLGSFGYTEGSAYNAGPVGPGTIEVNAWTLSAGVRRYFASSELRPFGEVNVGYQWTDVPGCDEINNPRATVGGGVEYAIAPRVSIEGSAGLAYSELNQRCSGPGGFEFELNQNTFSTFRTALSVTFYF